MMPPTWFSGYSKIRFDSPPEKMFETNNPQSALKALEAMYETFLESAKKREDEDKELVIRHEIRLSWELPKKRKSVKDFDIAGNILPLKKMTPSPYAPVNRAILEILERARTDGDPLARRGYSTYYFSFFFLPSTKEFPDYNLVIPKDKEMCLLTVKRKATVKKYRSLQEFIEDIHQIANNAKMYHSTGDHRISHYPDLAQGLIQYMTKQVEDAIHDNPNLASSPPEQRPLQPSNVVAE